LKTRISDDGKPSGYCAERVTWTLTARANNGCARSTTHSVRVNTTRCVQNLKERFFEGVEAFAEELK